MHEGLENLCNLLYANIFIFRWKAIPLQTWNFMLLVNANIERTLI